MRLQLEFVQPTDVMPAEAYVVLNSFSTSNTSGLPCLTPDCTAMGELDYWLKELEGQIAEIRKDTKRRFLAAKTSK